MIAALPLLALPLLLPPATAPPPQERSEAEAVADLAAGALKQVIDTGLRWLRGQQDPESGSYGSLEATIWTLRAFAESPRAYRVADGPFVSRAVQWLVAAQNEDGSWGAPDLAPEDRREVSRQACVALHELQSEPARKALQRAAAFLGEDRPAAPWSDEEQGGARARHVAKARELLQRRNDHGTWGQGAGEVLATARSLVELDRAHALVSRAGAGEKASAGAPVRPLPAFSPADEKRVVQSLERGAEYLLETADEAGLWGFQGRADPGITAMVTGALLAVPAPRPEAVQKAIDGALAYLASLQHEDGSIHAGQLANYVTSASILAFTRAGDPRYEQVVLRARDFLKRLQADEGEGYSPDDPFYGGVGYGGDERPDLSNLQMALEALAASGVEPSDPTFQKALVFLRRCQNRSESNDLQLERDGVTIASGNDGGAGYAPGDSKAGFIELADGRRIPRSYGSMSYALLKGYLFAGLERDDPRVAAVWKWIRENYTLDVNPGFEFVGDPKASYQGLFYYFLTMARALDLYGEETVVDGAGIAHAWRAELCGRLAAMQRADGSWLNENASRWYEGNPVLATSYAMVTLDVARPRKAAAGER